MEEWISDFCGGLMLLVLLAIIMGGCSGVQTELDRNLITPGLYRVGLISSEPYRIVDWRITTSPDLVVLDENGDAVSIIEGTEYYTRGVVRFYAKSDYTTRWGQPSWVTEIVLVGGGTVFSGWASTAINVGGNYIDAVSIDQVEYVND